jgi:tetratricopeptide (TPR) repeat protein
MNPNLQRALLLYEQQRFPAAEEELRQSLAIEPDDGFAHALLSLCLARRPGRGGSHQRAQQAIHLAPDFPLAHYALASVFHDRNRLAEALASIHEAIRLDPEDADYPALEAQIHLDARRWAQALEAAERGLQLDSEHVTCTNLRAIALVKLGRKAEAGATIDAALRRNPDNAVTHANQGWTYLEESEPRKALEHFREALRLDPTNEWARAGLVEALKARNIVYGLMLRYFLWMSKLSAGVQFGVIIGGYILNRILTAAAKTNPELAPWVLPLRILYLTFALLTWTADPLFNLLLRLSSYGRLALSPEQYRASNWFGAAVIPALFSLGYASRLV